MPKIRNIIALLLVAGALWHFYGDTFNDSGVKGVANEIRSDVSGVISDPKVAAAIETFNEKMQIWLDKLSQKIQGSEQPGQPDPEKPDLTAPTDQSFSIHNVELGDSRSEIEEETGPPERSTLNQYGVNWTAYHDNYRNFFMVAYNENDTVIGLYTNQDLVASKQEITIDSSKESVRSSLGEPVDGIRKGLVRYKIQNNGEYDTFLMDNSYVTVFYDKHEGNSVTAVQIISEELEQQKKKFFAEGNDELREGFEYQLFDLTNAARVNHGLSVLSWDETVKTTARDHSEDMAVNDYFSHTNPEGQSPFDRLDEDGISYRMAGENLASGQPSSIYAHEGLMNSLGHRENILQEGYKSLAVGVAFNEESRPFYTENFITK
ncbi:CAP domain-containing protein [Sediminibacillus massiliensis]|uniref:CAP domain-containing protein n=1 Tax=Sediminibacillus massiliensis TaxID=1926277 RepID=UPI0009883B17|nr:CAP domain-containing protein [Sediminibacillus massiliensis]